MTETIIGQKFRLTANTKPPGPWPVIYRNLKSKVTTLSFQFIVLRAIKPCSLNGYKPARAFLKTYSSAAYNVTLTRDKCVLGCTTLASNILNLTPNPRLGLPNWGTYTPRLVGAHLSL